MSEAKRHLKLIKTEIDLNTRAVITREKIQKAENEAVITREKIQKAENEKELEMLDKFEKWTRDLDELLDKEQNK